MTERCPLCNNAGRYPSMTCRGVMLICTRCEEGGRAARQIADAHDRQSAAIARAPEAPQTASENRNRRHDDIDNGRAAAAAFAIYATALVVIAGTLLVFGLALRAGWVVIP